jgi:Spy/CpxP family protein refolding chaperone
MRSFCRSMAFLLALVLVAGAPTAAFADKGRDKDKQGKRAQVLERIRTVRAARLVEILNLDQPTATRLFAVIDRFDDQILPLKMEMGQTRRELRKVIDAATFDEAVATRLIDRLTAARAQIAKLEDQRAAEVRKVLTVKQYATLVVVLPEVERQIEKAIRKAASRRGGGGPEDQPED